MMLTKTKVLVALTLLGTSCCPALADDAVPIQQLHAAVKSFIAGGADEKEELQQQDTPMTVEEILSKQVLSNSSPFIQTYDYSDPEMHKPPENMGPRDVELEFKQESPGELKFNPDDPKYQHRDDILPTEMPNPFGER